LESIKDYPYKGRVPTGLTEAIRGISNAQVLLTELIDVRHTKLIECARGLARLAPHPNRGVDQNQGLHSFAMN